MVRLDVGHRLRSNMDSLITILLFLMCCFRSGVCGESSERFIFDPNVSHMTTYIVTELYVAHMEMDQHIVGNLLFTDGSSLKTTDGKITQTVAGQAFEDGDREGVGEKARFRMITGFHQLNSSKVVVVDKENHCLKKVDRIDRKSSEFSGNCSTAGYADGSQALFEEPWGIIPDKKNQDKLLITEPSNKAVRHVDKHNGVVSTFYKFNSAQENPIGIIQDTSCGDLYMTTLTALYQLNYETKALTLLAGSPTQGGFRDGDFSSTKFNHTLELIRIDKGRKLIVTDVNINRLRVLDRDTNTTYSLCMGADGHIDGDINRCSVDRPMSLMVSGDSLYIGGLQRIRKVSGHDACGNITRILQPGEKSIDVKIVPGDSLQLPPGEYLHKMTRNAYNCTVHISVTEGKKDQDGDKETTTIFVALLLVMLLFCLPRRGGLERDDGGARPIRLSSATQTSEDTNNLGSSDSNVLNHIDNKTLEINFDGNEAKQTNLSAANTIFNKTETSGRNIKNISEKQNIKTEINYDTDKVNIGLGTIGEME